MKLTHHGLVGGTGMRSRRLLALTALAAALTSSATATEFAEQVTAWHQPHQATFERASELAFQGETAAANKLLLDLAERDGSGIAAFVIGNMLYKSDKHASNRLHKLAFEKFPEEPFTNLEFAMQLHRRGEHEAAIPLYKKAFQAPIGAGLIALLADCLVRTGNLREALQAWAAAGHANGHTAIDFAIYEIYGELTPVQRRGDLIERIKSGDKARLAELIELDLHFDTDWWNSEVFDRGLDADLALSAEMFGAGSDLHRQLTAYAAVARDEDMSAARAKGRLTEAGLVVGDQVVLPENSRFARGLCEMLLSRKFHTPADLLMMQGDELRRRIDTMDRDALHLLCMLKVRAGETIHELDTLGWKEWKDPAFAESYIIGRVTAGEIATADDPELLAALEVHPESNHLRLLRLKLAGVSGTKTQMLVDAIKAEYRRLSTGYGMPDSYTLKSLFHLLEAKLGEPDA